MDRFYLAENPRTNSGVAIVHMLEPVAIILVLEGHTDNCNEYNKKYKYINSDKVTEEYTLSIHHYFTTDMNADNHSAKAFKIIDKAWHWYKSYLEWEDTNIDDSKITELN